MGSFLISGAVYSRIESQFVNQVVIDQAWGNGCPLGKMPVLAVSFNGDFIKIKIQYDKSVMYVNDSAYRVCTVNLRVPNMSGKRLELKSFKLIGSSFINRLEAYVPELKSFYMHSQISLNFLTSADYVYHEGQLSTRSLAIEATPGIPLKQSSNCRDSNRSENVFARVSSRIVADKYLNQEFTEFGLNLVELELKIASCKI